MDFQNIRIIKKANVYFDGKVTSRTINFANGDRKTLGFMQQGEYEFNTEAEELMEILGGNMDVKVKGTDSFITYNEGDSFVVPANSSFKLIVKNYADYCCSYGE